MNAINTERRQGVYLSTVMLKAIAGLLGVLSIAFFAWAGVVWSTANKGLAELHAIRSEIYGLRAEITILQSGVNTNTRTLQGHETRPWHGRAGEDILELKAKVQSLDRDRNQ